MSEHGNLAEARRFRETFEFAYLGGPMFALDGEELESAAKEFDGRLTAALAAARAEAFEEAARVAVACGVSGGITHKARNQIAAAIRALAEKERP